MKFILALLLVALCGLTQVHAMSKTEAMAEARAQLSLAYDNELNLATEGFMKAMRKVGKKHGLTEFAEDKPMMDHKDLLESLADTGDVDFIEMLAYQMHAQDVYDAKYNALSLLEEGSSNSNEHKIRIENLLDHRRHKHMHAGKKTHSADSQCKERGGVCHNINEDTCDDGVVLTGYCPGPAHIKCCAPPEDDGTLDHHLAGAGNSAKEPTLEELVADASDEITEDSMDRGKCRQCKSDFGADWEEDCATKCAAIPSSFTVDWFVDIVKSLVGKLGDYLQPKAEIIQESARDSVASRYEYIKEVAHTSAGENMANFIGIDKSKCPELEFSWECMQSLSPHLGIVGVTGNLGPAVGGLEAVSDYTNFEVGLFGYGGIVIGTSTFNAGIAGYAGIGYKGTAVSSSVADAYSAHFLSFEIGGDYLLGGSLVFAVSANAILQNLEGAIGVNETYLLTLPDFMAVKTVNFALGVSTWAGATVNGATTYYKHFYTIECTHPHCYAATLLIIPGLPISKIISMKLFMDQYCAEDSPHKDGMVCSAIEAIGEGIDWIKEQAAKGWHNLKEGVKYSIEAGSRLLTNLRADFSRRVGRAKKSVDDFLKKHVAGRLDRFRSNFEEEYDDSFIPIPSGKGAYLRIRDCDSVDSDIDEPYWTCKATSGNTTEASTSVGVKHNGVYVWDRNSGDYDKSGFGRKFRNSGRCVKCWLNQRHRMGHSWRMGVDEEFENHRFTVCDGPDQEYFETDVSDSHASCRVMYDYQS